MPAVAGRRSQGRYGLGKRRAAGGGSQSAASAQGGAAPGAGAAGGQGNKPKYRPLKVLREIETNKLLTGKDLAKAARALTALEVRPQVRGYRLLAQQLHKERETEAQGLGRLGTSLQGQVGNVYRNIAAAEAQGIAQQQALAGQLNQTSTQIATEGQQALAGMQGTQLEGLTGALAARGAPGGGTAQQELAQAVAAQRASQSANSQSAQQFAAQQGSSYGQLATSLAGATQMQGGAAVGGIGQTVLGRVAKSNREYGQGIQEARSKLAEARANRGAVYNKNLLQLRGQEQEFALGRAAVRGEKEQNALARREANEDREQRQIENSQWAKEFGLAKYEATHPGASNEEIREKRQEIKQDVNEVRSSLATLVGAEGAPKNKQQLNALIGALNSKVSANPALVRKIALRWWEKRRRKVQAQRRKEEKARRKVEGTVIQDVPTE